MAAILCSFSNNITITPPMSKVDVVAKNISVVFSMRMGCHRRNMIMRQRLLQLPIRQMQACCCSYSLESPQLGTVPPGRDGARRAGVNFSSIGVGCVMRMTLDNGTTASLILPDGLITSFKAKMWHGGTVELLHTTVSDAADGGAPVIQGGLSLAISCENDAGLSWSPSAWVLYQVIGSPQKSFQVELISRNAEGDVEAKHLITLEQDQLESEILVSNSSPSSLRLVGLANSHLAVSTPDATYAVGLGGSDFTVVSPIPGKFNIIPPEFDKRNHKHDVSNFLTLDLSKWIAKNHKADDDDIEKFANGRKVGEEEDNYKHLAGKLSRIYSNAPQDFTIIDRGRRNSITLRRRGFDEVYMLSPGSEYEWYSKYSYICVGHSSLLEPIVLNAKSQWRGGLQLQNPNS